MSRKIFGVLALVGVRVLAWGGGGGEGGDEGGMGRGGESGG